MSQKRFNLGWGAAALVLLTTGGIGFADGPAPVGPAGPYCAEGGCAAEGCCQEKCCVPAPVKKKVVLRHYGVKCEDFCLCKPTFLGGLFNLQEALEKDRDLYVGRGPCDKECEEGCCGCCTNCGYPRVKKYLLIHIREHSECEIKCQSPDQLAAAAVAEGPAKAPATPKAASGEFPEPRTPGLNPAK
jgi:hypothetical protein